MIDTPAHDDDPEALLIGAMSREIVGEAVTSMPRLFLSAIVAYGAVNYFGDWLSRTGNAMAMSGGLTPVPIIWINIAGQFLLLFIESAILSSVAVAVHRFILCDDTNKGVVTPLNRRVVAFTMWLLALRVPSYLAAGASALVVSSHPALALLVVPVFIGSIVVGVRMSLMFPAIAIDVQYDGPSNRLAVAWRLSMGRFWRLIGSGLWAVLPLVVVALVATLGLALALSLVIPVADSSFATWIARLNPFTRAISGVLVAALGAAALSWNYRIVTSAPRP